MLQTTQQTFLSHDPLSKETISKYSSSFLYDLSQLPELKDEEKAR